MNRINFLFTLSSLTVLLVTIERFSSTTKIILQPYDFLRLHEVFQILTLILFTVLIPFFLLKEVTHDFEFLKTKKGTFLVALFIVGIYLYATGNGVHEIGSYLFNTYCDTEKITKGICGSTFFNDYYFGNILYFIGAFLMNIVLVLFEKMKAIRRFQKKEMIILFINAIIYSFAIFAYAAFDKVLVGFVYSVVMTLALLFVFVLNKNKISQKPVVLSLTTAYILGTFASLFVRFS